MGLFDSAGVEAAKEITEKADKLLDKADNLVRDAELRLGSLAHGILDRFSKCVIHLEITPPKAKASNPTPEQDKVY
jgi:hypothetical protein